MSRDLLIPCFFFFILAVLVGERPASAGEGEFLDIKYFSPRDSARKSLKIYLPAAKKASAPLVIHLCGNNFPDPLPRESVDFARRRGWILMKVKGLEGPDAYEVDEFELRQAVRTVRERFSVNPDRIYLLGLGVRGVLRCAFRSPDRYAAVAASSPYTDFSTYYHLFYGKTLSTLYQRTIMNNASTGTLVDNAQHLPTLLVVDSKDPHWVRRETEKMIRLLEQSRRKAFNPGTYIYEVIRNLDEKNKILSAYRFFEGKSRTRNPPRLTLTTHNLHNHRAYWVEIMQLSSPYNPGTLEVITAKNAVMIRTERVESFQLNLTVDMTVDWGWDLDRPVKFIINKHRVISGPIRSMRFRLTRKGNKSLWIEEAQTVVSRRVSSPAAPPALRKTPETPGWISPMAPFVITYGTIGSTEEKERNKTLAYNLSQGYGAFFQAKRPPVPDSDFSSARLSNITENLILIGSSDSHSIFRDLVGMFPFEISRERVKILNGTYPGNSPVVAIYPNPLNPSRSLMFINHLDSEGLWPWSWETVMWAWPDYVIFYPPGKTVTQGKQGIYSRVAEGGFFPSDWNSSRIGKEKALKGKKEVLKDIDSPWVEEWSPAPDSKDNPVCPMIMVRLRDSESGVDLQSVSLFLNDEEIDPQISGSPEFLVLTYMPEDDFLFGKKIRLEVLAQDLASPPNEMEEEMTFTIKPEPLYTMRVNCGGPAWTDPKGNEWSADQSYSKKTGWGYIGGRRPRSDPKARIRGTDLGPMYNIVRWWDEQSGEYRFDVDNRTYRIKLHFAETHFKKNNCPPHGTRYCYPCPDADCRVFDILVEGMPLVENFNILYQVGSDDVSTTLGLVTEVVDGQLNIILKGRKDKPIISGIEIISVSQDDFYDQTAPEISGWNPWQDAQGVSTDTEILVSVTDDDSGVDLSSIIMKVNNIKVTPEITGNSFRYNLYWRPGTDEPIKYFDYESTVTVIVGADDLAEIPNHINGINSFVIKSE